MVTAVLSLPFVMIALRMAVLWRADRKLRRIVFSDLDAAMDNGAFMPDGYLYGYTVDDIANDLTLYAEDCSGYRESELAPHVRAWIKARP